MLHSTGKIIKHKTELLKLAEELGNVSKACQVPGYSRDTFYRFKSALDEGGVEALLERTRHKPNMANRVDEAIERLSELGGRVEQCADRSHTLIDYNSCRNRQCPKCQSATAGKWLEARQAELLPVPVTTWSLHYRQQLLILPIKIRR